MSEEYFETANDRLDSAYEEPMSLEEYVQLIFEQPKLASHAAKYLLDAIEDSGTRTVVEQGEERERYRFFDDPWNDGENAVLGNTDVLNEFVRDIRSIASDQGKSEKIIWVTGPTATGKSELKRCLVNGLREYSQTADGRRYTLEWNINESSSGGPGMTYGDGGNSVPDDGWYESPVQNHPLSAFPDPVQSDIVDDLNDAHRDDVDISVDTDLDPFSREAKTHLEEQYRREGTNDLFSAITSLEHCRVKNYIVDTGQGVGVLHAEDDGSPKERLVGSWMPDMFGETNSRGRKNPQAFSYDGVLSQGNGLLTIVEDAGQHANLLTKLLNIPEEEHVKLDKGIGMDIDTQILLISNPDLEKMLESGNGEVDELKAIKRRLLKHEFTYLTGLSLELQLLRREVLGDTTVWTTMDQDARKERVQEGCSVSVTNSEGRPVERELAPHTLEAAAMFNVLSRLDAQTLPTEFTVMEKAILFDTGEVTVNGETYEIDDIDISNHLDGRKGIPVTYTRDILSSLLQDEQDRSHELLDVESVIMPDDVISAMNDGLDDAPVFDDSEVLEYGESAHETLIYIRDEQETDVLDAVLSEHKVSDEAITEYLKHVYAWATDEQVETDDGMVDPDELKMKVFETEKLGIFSESEYTGTDPSGLVESWRQQDLVTPLKRINHERDNDERSFWDVPEVREKIHDYDWSDVKRRFENFDPFQWDDPPEGTETEQVKERAIEYMVENGYTHTSAELTSRRIMDEVGAKEWG